MKKDIQYMIVHHGNLMIMCQFPTNCRRQHRECRCRPIMAWRAYHPLNGEYQSRKSCHNYLNHRFLPILVQSLAVFIWRILGMYWIGNRLYLWRTVRSCKEITAFVQIRFHLLHQVRDQQPHHLWHLADILIIKISLPTCWLHCNKCCINILHNTNKQSRKKMNLDQSPFLKLQLQQRLKRFCHPEPIMVQGWLQVANCQNYHLIKTEPKRREVLGSVNFAWTTKKSRKLHFYHLLPQKYASRFDKLMTMIIMCKIQWD